MKLLPNPHQRMSENRLLASLPEGLKTRWQPHLELVELPLGQVLYEASRLMADVFFPITSWASPCSWAEIQRLVVQWYKAPAWGFA